ncbi:MAG: GldG family protein [Clostridia bacterium]|nr:GldG family protein [Clostridia bacterium]
MKGLRPIFMGIRKSFGGRFRAGSYSVAAAAVVVAIAIFLNLIVGSLPSTMTEIDLTANSIYALSDQTKRIAASLDRDVTMYIICNQGNEDDTIQRLLNRYADLSTHIKVTSVDPTIEPTFLDKYELDISQLYENSVLVVCEDGEVSRSRLVGYDEIFVTDYSMDYYSYSYTTTTSFNGENSLTNALHYVSSDDLPKVYTLTGHGEEALSTSITDMLAQDNFEHEDLSILTADALPEDASAVIIHQPSTDLNEDEAALLVSYLENGGNVVLVTGYMSVDGMPNLLSVTRAMGLELGEGIIIEGDRNMRLTRYPYYILPDVASHDVTDSIINAGYYILSPLAQPIVEAADSTASITWLLTTSSEAYAKVDALNMTTTSKEEGDADGPFHVGAVSENSGKLLWLTGDGMFDEYIDSAVSGGNSNLLLNALNWMGGQEESISIRAKSLDETGLSVTQSESSFWSTVMIGVIPAALVVMGIIIWARRKRR